MLNMKRNRYLNRLKNYFSLSFYIPINSKELLLNNQFLVPLASGLLPLKTALWAMPVAELQVHVDVVFLSFKLTHASKDRQRLQIAILYRLLSFFLELLPQLC